MSLTRLSPKELQTFMADKFPDLKEVTGEPPKAPAKRKIVIGILSYDAKMHCKNAMALSQALVSIAAQGWDFSYILREGDSMVARGRNILVAKFLEEPELKDATDLVLIDTDLDFPGTDIVKLCQHDVDIVGGAYPFKDMKGNFPLRWSPDGLVEEDGRWSVSAVTPGFFRITRKALERMVLEHQHLQFNDQAMNGKRAWMFFDNICRPSGVWDEGYVFCERARQAGFKVYLDPDFVITHIGMHAFRHGSVRQWLDVQAEKFTHLESEFPNVPALKLMRKVMGEKIDLEQETNVADDQHRNAVQAGTLEGDDPKDTPEHAPQGHGVDDLSGQGRPGDDPVSVPTPEGRPAAYIGKTPRGHAGRKVRPGTNGSASGHLPAGG